MTLPNQAVFDFAGESKIMLINVVHRRPSWQAVIKKAEVLVDGHEVKVNDKRTTRPRSNLIPSSWHERFNTINLELGHLLDRNTLPFPLSGIRQIPSHVIDETLGEIDGLRTAQNEIVAELLEQWDDIIAWNRDYWDEHGGFEQVAAALPVKTAIPGKYGIDVRSIVLGNGTDEELLKSGVENLIIGPRKQLSEALDRLRQLIDAEGKVTSKSFNAMNRAIDLYRTFSQVPGLSDPELDGQIERLEKLVNSQSEAKRFAKTTTPGKSLLALINQVVSICEDEDQATNLVVKFGAKRLISVS